MKEKENDSGNHPYFDVIDFYCWPDHGRAAGEIIGEGSPCLKKQWAHNGIEV
jgi:hypothetical protein